MRLLTLVLFPALLVAGQSRVARLGEFQGRVEVQLTAADPWIPAERNLPLTESAWLRTASNARVEIEMDDGSVWRLGADSQGALSDYTQLSTGQRVTMLALDHGTAYYTGQPFGNDVTTLLMPGAQVTLLQGSRVRQTARAGWSQVAVFDGAVRFSSPTAEMDIRSGTTARVDPTKARFLLDPEIVSEPLDQWSEARDQSLSAPVSAAYVNAAYGLADLDAAGQWMNSETLGTVWKPEVPDGWLPYREGRWRYYDALGYTWVSRDSWGWLPFHNGRWARLEKLGWVWQPSLNPVFHPAEVYWLRGADFAGWGPLAPGEEWNEPNPGAVTPRGYLAGVTSYAPFLPDVRYFSGLGYGPPTPEQMKMAFFFLALPSPAFSIARLDATRPNVDAAGTRVLPYAPGHNFGDPAPPPVPDTATSDAAIAVVAVPVAVPVAEQNVIVNTPPAPRTAGPVNVPAVPKPTPAVAVSKPPAVVPPRAPVHDRPPVSGPGEPEFHRRVMQDIEPGTPDFSKALEDLDAWTKAYPNSPMGNDRAYYYIHVYNSTAKPERVLETAAPLLETGVRSSYRDQQQVLQILVAASGSLAKLKAPNAVQVKIGQLAAHQLLDFLPEYFAPARKPADITAAAWSIARTQLEEVAQQALARKPAGRGTRSN